MKKILIISILICSLVNVFGQLPVRTKTDRFWINDTSFLFWMKNSPLSIAYSPSSVAAPSGTYELKTFFLPVSTVGITEVDLYSYTIPANVLSVNGSSIEFNVTFINLEVNAGFSTIKVYFAGQTTPDFLRNESNFLFGTAFAAVSRIKLIRTSSINATLFANSSGSGMNPFSFADLTGLNFTIPNIIKITGICASNSFSAKHGNITYRESK